MFSDCDNLSVKNDNLRCVSECKFSKIYPEPDDMYSAQIIVNNVHDIYYPGIRLMSKPGIYLNGESLIADIINWVGTRYGISLRVLIGPNKTLYKLAKLDKMLEYINSKKPTVYFYEIRHRVYDLEIMI